MNFQKALTISFGGRRRDNIFTLIWLFLKSPQYKDRRNFIFDRQSEIRGRIRLRKEIRKPLDDSWIKLIAKDDSWKGGYIPIPFEFKDEERE